MAKQDSWNNVQNISQTIRFNDQTILNGVPAYTGITIVTNAQATSDGGGLRDIQRTTVAGPPRPAKYTPSELANMVKGSSNSTGNFLLAELTAIYNDAVGGLA